jgi:uncharacterized protein YqhQ
MVELRLGGQAVIEGVLMRTPEFSAVAVRQPDDSIKVTDLPYTSWTTKPVWGWPVIRGMVVFAESIYIGMKALSISAEQADDEEPLSTTEIVGTIIFSLFLALALFKLLPLFIANLTPSGNNIVFNLVDGGMKILLLVAYMWGISFMDDVHRMFQYHGAEHKTIACYQAGEDVTKENIKRHAKEHPSCGTSFLFFVVFVSILVYMTIPFQSSFWMKYGLRIVLLPVVAGVSYEVIKLATKHKHNTAFRVLAWPGIALQYITTKEPEDEMIDVATAALDRVVSQAQTE